MEQDEGSHGVEAQDSNLIDEGSKLDSTHWGGKPVVLTVDVVWRRLVEPERVGDGCEPVWCVCAPLKKCGREPCVTAVGEALRSERWSGRLWKSRRGCYGAYTFNQCMK